MKLNEFFDPIEDAETAKFNAPGDSVSGRIAKDPEWIEDKFNPGEKVLSIVVQTAEGNCVRIFARKPQLAAVGRALAAAKVTDLAEGGVLALAYESDRETSNGNTAKLWDAEYVAPERAGDRPISTAELSKTGEDLPPF